MSEEEYPLDHESVGAPILGERSGVTLLVHQGISVLGNREADPRDDRGLEGNRLSLVVIWGFDRR